MNLNDGSIRYHPSFPLNHLPDTEVIPRLGLTNQGLTIMAPLDTGRFIISSKTLLPRPTRVLIFMVTGEKIVLVVGLLTVTVQIRLYGNIVR